MVEGTGSPMSGAPGAQPAARSTTSGRLAPRASSAGRGAWAVVCLVVVGLLAASCSGDHGSDATGPAPSGAGATAPSGNEDAPDGEDGAFGTLESPCGGGDAAGATATGVTDDAITIGYGDDAGYPAAPGLDKELSDAMEAMIEWCNEQGGINGREIVGNYYDAKATEVTAAITQACNDGVFMLVGQGWVLDSGQETVRIECELPSVPGYTVATAVAHGPGIVQPLPNPGDQVPASAAFQLAELFPDAVKRAAFVFAEFPATRETRDKYEAAFPQAGWEFQGCDQLYNIAGEADWKPFAANLKDCGIEAVVWVGSPNPNFQNLLAAADQVGFEPQAWLSDANQYDAGFARWNGQNGGVGDDVYVRIATTPFELADSVPAVRQYLDLVEGSGGTPALLGVQATSAFLLWATAVDGCGSDVTAACVFEQIGQQDEWTAGGLHSPTNPAANQAATCGILLKLDGDGFERVVPSDGDDGFDCRDDYVIDGLSTDALALAGLDGDRVASEHGTFTP
jgi:ABC-type branched-subunit amino acid transport system substrate-binding protein